ncbi:MAG: type II toxin-antitoxin system PemK/MazF family toxin [Myxococcales bacterium]|nr:type II toxin-antitoxin system PemK/MazF family toxin [Myxococcales bacterium]
MARDVRRGDLFWVQDGRADGGEAAPIPHPHLVVQDDVFNRSRLERIVMMALTTNPKRSNEAGNVLLESGEGGLPRQSVIIVSQITSVERSRLGEHIGCLSSERVEQALAGLRFQQASFFRR